MTRPTCHLQWALIDGKLRNISDFSHLKPKERPAATCPICMHPVIMKLGNERIHHYAHHLNSLCMATNPETALHFNVKSYLAYQLEASRSLIIQVPCSSPHLCKQTTIIEWLSDWDSVRVEYTLGTRRPDIALLKAGSVIGAIEIHVTHEVDQEKAKYLESLNVPWIEIEASEKLYLGEDRWNPTKPLPVSKQQPALWKCDYCIVLEERERQREHEANNFTRISSVKIVDFYFPSGKKFREVYELHECVENGCRTEVWLTRRSDKKIIAGARAPITVDAMATIAKALEIELKNIHRKTNAQIDSPMKWTAWSPTFEDDHTVYSDRYFPRRYAWWPAKRKWFLPKVNRNITWGQGE